MPRLRIKDVGKIGVIRDRQPIELPPNAWSDGKNMMFRNGFAESRRGQARAFQQIKGSADFIMAFAKGQLDFIYAGNTKIHGFAHDDFSVNAIVDLTRSAGAGGDYSIGAVPGRMRWTGTVLGNIPILTNNADPPQFLSAGASQFDNLRNLPANFTCRTMIAFKNYLIAMDINEGSGQIPNLVRWSTLADVNTLPSSWDYTDPTLDAGRAMVGEESDPILTARILKDVLYIYRAHSVWRCDFIGGNFVFRFQPVFELGGTASRYGVSGNENFHFVFTRDMDLIAHDGVSAQSLLDDRNKEYIRSTMDKNNIPGVLVYYDPNRDEVILGYPQTDFAGAQIALVYNVSAQTYAYRDMHSVSHMAYGTLQLTEAPIEHWWSETADTGPTNEDRNLMAGGDMIYLDDYVYSDDLNTGTTMIASHLVREDFPFHLFGVDDNRIIEIKAIYPHIQAVGTEPQTINVYVIAKDSLDQKVSDSGVLRGPFTFRVGTDYKVDMRVTCRYPGFIFEAGGAGFQWRMSGYDIEFDVAGYQ